LAGGSLPVPMKLQKVSRCTAKNAAVPNSSANAASSGAVDVISSAAKIVQVHADRWAALLRHVSDRIAPVIGLSAPPVQRLAIGDLPDPGSEGSHVGGECAVVRRPAARDWRRRGG
jgi:hypothetical protein